MLFRSFGGCQFYLEHSFEGDGTVRGGGVSGDEKWPRFIWWRASKQTTFRRKENRGNLEVPRVWRSRWIGSSEVWFPLHAEHGVNDLELQINWNRSDTLESCIQSDTSLSRVTHPWISHPEHGFIASCYHHNKHHSLGGCCTWLQHLKWHTTVLSSVSKFS